MKNQRTFKATSRQSYFGGWHVALHNYDVNKIDSLNRQIIHHNIKRVSSANADNNK